MQETQYYLKRNIIDLDIKTRTNPISLFDVGTQAKRRKTREARTNKTTERKRRGEESREEKMREWKRREEERRGEKMRQA